MSFWAQNGQTRPLKTAKMSKILTENFDFLGQLLSLFATHNLRSPLGSRTALHNRFAEQTGLKNTPPLRHTQNRPVYWLGGWVGGWVGVFSSKIF